MTLPERLGAFQRTFTGNVASWPWCVTERGRLVLYAIWVIGNDYRGPSTFYGAYPPSYLKRVMALFPDAQGNVLHAFSGSVPPGEYVRLDSNHGLRAEICGTVYDVAQFVGARRFALVIADPPYSAADAVKYGTPMIHRRKALRALAEVTAPGGHLCWLDTCWPMHSKKEWLTVGRILVQRSTNHRARVLSIFERVA